MEENINIIKSASIPAIEEIIVDFSRWLETASQEALVNVEGALQRFLRIWQRRSASMPMNLLATSPRRRSPSCSRHVR